MASTYPTALDVFTNPLTTNPLTAPSHAQQHSDINDAVEALEAKVAIGATVLGTYTAYTPTFFNFTVGNAILDIAYCRVNNWVHYYGSIQLGSTSSVTGNIVATLPINCNTAFSTYPVTFGFATYRDISSGTNYLGNATQNNASSIAFIVPGVASTYPTPFNVNATVPFTWTPADGDRITFNTYYRTA